MSDTLYLSSLNPITIEDNPSELSVKFGKKFLKEQPFRTAQNKVARRGYGFGQALLYQNQGKDFADLAFPPEAQQYLSAIPDLTFTKKGVERTMVDAIIFLLCFNTVLDIENIKEKSIPLFHYVCGKKEIKQAVENYPSEQLASILIPHNTSKEVFLEWVKDNWDKMEKEQVNFLEFRARYIPKDLAIHEEIFDLRNRLDKNGNTRTFSKIADKMSERYPGDKRFLSESDVRKMYHRHKEYVISGFSDAQRMSALVRDVK